MTKTRTRRGWLAAAVGLTFAGAGAGLAWRHSRQQSVALSAAEEDFWRQQFRQPNDAMLSMASFHGKPLLVNFWATWCPPCIEELPLLNTFYLKNAAKSWQVLGLAVDQATPVQHFLTRRPLDFQIALAGFPGVELSRALGNPKGGLPFSVLFDRTGSIVYRKLGKLSEIDLLAVERLLVAS